MAIALADPFNAQGSKTAGTTLVRGLSSIGAGTLCVVFFAMDNAAGTVSCADDAGNTYAVAADVTNASGVRTVILYAMNCAALSAGNITITHPSVTARSMVYATWSGAATSAALDASNTGTTTGSTATTSNAATPSEAGELIVGVTGAEDTNTTGAPTEPAWATAGQKHGTTGGGAASNIYVNAAYEIQSAALT